MTQRTTRNGERGIALVSAMLMLVLLMVLSATFMLTAVGERNTSAGSHATRATTFAADAGVRSMQQMLTNMARARVDSLTNVWAGSGNILPNPDSLFAGGALTLTSTSPRFTTTATVAFVGDSITPQSQTYDYRWTIVSDGEAGFGGRRRIQSSGTMRVSAARGSFSDYLVYTNNHTSPSGGGIWFTSRTAFDGRVHTNGQFRFAYNPTFNDQVTSVSSTARYYNNGAGSGLELNADHNGTVDVPTFAGGFTRGVPVVSLPDNAFGQMNAALGLNPNSTTRPDNAAINLALTGTSASTSPANGIYVAATGTTVTGGVYVQGSLDDCLLTIDGSGRQVYTLKQGATTRTITVDVGAGRTYVFDGTNTTTLTGTPRGVLYVAGSINKLRGPDRNFGAVVPAVALNTKMLITAENDIVLHKDVVCQNYDAGTNVLGLYSADGSVRVSTSAPDDMNLDAFVMAAGSTGIFGVDDHDRGDPRGTFNLRGGMVTEYYGAFGTFSGNTATSGFGRNFQYDRRGLTPPYYPTTGRFTSNSPSATRQTWMEM